MPNGPKVSARRIAEPARRLAGAVGRQRRGLAGRHRAERADRLIPRVISLHTGPWVLGFYPARVEFIILEYRGTAVDLLVRADSDWGGRDVIG